MAIASGTQLGRYEIKSSIGAGGMGEVYLARDTQLERFVALKVLPVTLAQDAARMRRFIQEAKAASALNHPNIITIHEIGADSSTHFIATEYIDGQTLRDLMATRPMDMPEILDVASQVASALVVAHAAGITHRDIKPENIMIRPDGYVKVLDFGLCKLTEVKGVSPTSATIADTDPNVIMGTPNYMSPEQVRGLELDNRTDIWNLGVLLYEMVTGHRAFDGPSTGDIIVSILEREPPPLNYYSHDVPEQLAWVVSKSLRKERAERYQSIKEVFIDLRNIKHRLWLGPEQTYSSPYHTIAFAKTVGSIRDHATVISTSPLSSISQGASHRTGVRRSLTQLKRYRRPAALVTATLCIFFAGVALGIVYFVAQRRHHDTPETAGQTVRSVKLTTTGKISRAAISPDGKYVVYATSDGGKQSLWVRQVATPSHVLIVAEGDVVYRGLTFAHDGDFLYYVVQEKNNPIQTLYQVPVLGGPHRKILSDIDSPITLSPNSSHFAFIRRDRVRGEDSLVIAAADGAAAERTLITKRGMDFYAISGPSWSPDGNWIACGAGSREGGRYMSVVTVGISDGVEKMVTAQKWFDVGRVAWAADQSKLIISAVEQGSNQAQVWRVAYPDGRATKLIDDFNDYRDLSTTSDSNMLVTVQNESRVNVWTAHANDNASAKQITSGVGEYDGVRGLAWMPDGNIVYVSRKSGSQDIWTMRSDGSEQKQLTTAATRADVHPTVAGDGRYIVFTSNRLGNSNIWRMNADGSDPVQITSGSGEEFPHLSPDGQTIVYTSTSSSNFTVWRIPVDGGSPEQLTRRLSQWPAVSPNGKLIACWYRDDVNSPWRIAVLPLAGGDALQVFEVSSTQGSSIPVRWTKDGRTITFVDTRDGVSNIWGQPLGGGAPKQMTDFKSEQIFWFDWSPDGKQLTCARGSVTSDVILMSGYR